MLLTIDYIEALLKNGTPTNDKNSINEKQLDEQLERIQYGIDHNFTGNTIQEKLENTVALKIAYLVIKSIMQANENEGLDRREIERTAKETEFLSQKKSALRKSDNNYNEYYELKCEKYASADKLQQNYLRELEWFNKDLEKEILKENINIDDAINIQTLYLSIIDAYKNLNNPNFKLKLDERLMMPKNLNKRDLYVPRNFAEITYIPTLKIKKQPDGTETVNAYVLENFQGDTITIIKTAEAGYGRFRKENGETTVKVPKALEEYKILKKYKNPQLAEERKRMIKSGEIESEWSDEDNSEIFTVYTNLNRQLLTQGYADVEYIKYHANVLFSTYNMEQAMKNNGGYLGNVSIDRNSQQREYTLAYDRDENCIAIELNKAKKEKNLGNEYTVIKIDNQSQTKQDKGER